MLFLFSIYWNAASGWWVIACLLLGILYGWALYRQPISLENKWRNLLLIFRFAAVFIISLLLLAPLVASVKKRLEKPLILIVQDNSSSIDLARKKGFDPKDFVARLANLKQTLGDDYDVREFHFNAGLREGLPANFTGKQTAISTALSALYNQFSNQNIGALILATDGIYNYGRSPLPDAEKLKTNIFAIALGDTVPKRDLLIAYVNYNKTAFLGNDFETEIFVQAYQAKGETMQLTVSEEGTKVFSQSIPVNAGNFQKLIPVKLRARNKGIRKYTVTLNPLTQEASIPNNTETLYVNVLDGRQKILVLYDAPHPDISAIRQSLQSNKNYEVKTSLLKDFKADELTDYSLVVFYQLPGTAQQSNEIFTKAAKLKIACWYIAGAQTADQLLNGVQNMSTINGSSGKMQEVFARPSETFTAFTLSDSTRMKLTQLPPLMARFGIYGSGSGTVLLYQKIDNVDTAYPLLVFDDNNGRRTGLLVAEGLWRWRLAEYERYANHQAFDELMSQSVQYLTAKDNRSRFRVYPTKTVFDENEQIVLSAELYNEAYELINSPEVRIDLKSKSGKTYNFLFSRNNHAYLLDAGLLPPDEYTFNASTKMDSKNYVQTGQLVVKWLDLETRQTAADHQLLHTLAKSNHGRVLPPEQLDLLPALIRKNEDIRTIIYQDKTYQELIDLKWIFLIILAFIALEWLVRKRNGFI
ncbi:MAG: hypothetical protein ACOH2A_10000 [Sphingobacteriaceae bacterium]